MIGIDGHLIKLFFEYILNVHFSHPCKVHSQSVNNQLQFRPPLTEDAPNYEGEQLFITNCARCHAINGVTERELDGSIVADSMAMYGNIEEFRNHSDGTLSQGKYTGAANLTSGAAPNLTHFASRSSYAASFRRGFLKRIFYEDNGNIPKDQTLDRQYRCWDAHPGICV